jgi:hypothetical protein
MSREMMLPILVGPRDAGWWVGSVIGVAFVRVSKETRQRKLVKGNSSVKLVSETRQ